MPQIEILDSLAELAKTNKSLKQLTQQPSHPTKTNMSQQQHQQLQNWHWQHYHLPYQFGHKKPNFNDYDDTALDADNKNDLANEKLTGNGAKIEQKWLKNYDHLAQLSCDSGEMILRLNFTEPFKGIVYPNHDRLSACRFFGDGHHNYELRLPLRGCGTRQVSYQCTGLVLIPLVGA